MPTLKPKTKKNATTPESKAKNLTDLVIFDTIITAPHFTEKASKNEVQRKYTFRISPKANKSLVAEAIERMYGVTVEKVNIVSNYKKKNYSNRGFERIKRSAFRKAIVTLQKGASLDVLKI